MVRSIFVVTVILGSLIASHSWAQEEAKKQVKQQLELSAVYQADLKQKELLKQPATFDFNELPFYDVMDALVVGSHLFMKDRQPAWQEEGDWRSEFELD